MDHTIRDVPRDGNCFYHALSDQINHIISHDALRRLVALHLNENDAMLFNAVHDVNFTLEQVKTAIRATGLVWADDIEINALSRALAGLRIVIVDDEHKTVHKIGSTSKIRAILLRRNLHYQSIHMSNYNQERLLGLLKHSHSSVLNKHDGVECSLWVLVTVFVLLNFLYCAL